MCEEVKLDVDDEMQYDPHYRILAVVYVNGTNLNEKLPSEFDSYVGKVDYTPSPTQTPGFEFIFAIIGVAAVVCLIRRWR
jgi:PGF-CTERM protein